MEASSSPMIPSASSPWSQRAPHGEETATGTSRQMPPRRVDNDPAELRARLLEMILANEKSRSRHTPPR